MPDYYDLNVPVGRTSTEHERRQILEELHRLGYGFVAHNTVTWGKLHQQHACSLQPITFPAKSRRSGGNAAAHGGASSNQALQPAPAQSLRQLTRITVVADSLEDAQALTANSPALQTYNLVAVRPTTDKAFRHACESSWVDIVQIDLTQRLAFTVGKRQVDAATASHKWFELCVGDLLRSPQGRRLLLSSSRQLLAMGGGRRLLLTGGAETVLQTRGPLDVANLAQLMGLSQEAARATVTSNPADVVRCAKARKCEATLGMSIAVPAGKASDELLAALRPPPPPLQSSIRGRGGKRKREEAAAGAAVKAAKAASMVVEPAAAFAQASSSDDERAAGDEMDDREEEGADEEEDGFLRLGPA